MKGSIIRVVKLAFIGLTFAIIFGLISMPGKVKAQEEEFGSCANTPCQPGVFYGCYPCSNGDCQGCYVANGDSCGVCASKPKLYD